MPWDEVASPQRQSFLTAQHLSRTQSQGTQRMARMAPQAAGPPLPPSRTRAACGAPSRPVRDVLGRLRTRRASLSVRTRSVQWLSLWVAVPAQPPLRLCCLVTGAPSGVRGTARLWAWSPGTWRTQSSAPG